MSARLPLERTVSALCLVLALVATIVLFTASFADLIFVHTVDHDGQTTDTDSIRSVASTISRGTQSTSHTHSLSAV